MTMDCWHCGMELIWGGDHDEENHEDYDMVTNLKTTVEHDLSSILQSSFKKSKKVLFLKKI